MRLEQFFEGIHICVVDYSFGLVLVMLNVQVRDHWGIGMIHHPVRIRFLPIGLSFIKLAASKQTVRSSENVITLSPIANVIALLTD